MKKLFQFIGMVIMVSMLMSACEKKAEQVLPSELSKQKNSNGCVKIQDGVIVYAPGHYLEGQPISTGYDVFGYNYQPITHAHAFKDPEIDTPQHLKMPGLINYTTTVSIDINKPDDAERVLQFTPHEMSVLYPPQQQDLGAFRNSAAIN